MRRTIAAALITALLALAACSSGNTARAAVVNGTGGITPGAPVLARFSTDNGVNDSVRAAATSLGLGPVTVVGFHPDCSPIDGTVVLCRNNTLTNGNTITNLGTNTCVVELDPKLGAGTRAQKAIRSAMRKCLP